MAEKKTIMDWKADSDYFSGKVSDSVRQLTLAGIAILWVIREYNKMDINAYISAFFWPLLFLILTLGMDFVHYLLGYLINEQIFLSSEEKIKKRILSLEDDITAAPWKINMIKIPFWLKIILVVISYCCIVVSLVKTLSDFHL